MINVNEITAKLAKLPDQALQQYAQMHKTDPYLMALAVTEAGRRKAIRQGQQTQMAGQEQPKVVDQELMAMAPQVAQPMPEETGIAQLPVEEADYAGGGIVAFAGGGAMPVYGGPYGGGRILPDTTGYEGKTLGDLYDYVVEGGKRIHKAGTKEERDRVAREEFAAKQEQQNLANRDALRRYDAGLNTVQVPMPEAAAAAVAKKSAGDADTGAGAGPRAASPTGIASLASPESALKAAGQFYAGDDLKNEIGNYRKSVEARNAAELQAFNEGKPAGKAYEGLEALLNKEADAEAGDKKAATGMAIFKAGLAMMAGTSSNAFENIAKGGIAGLDDYSAAMKDFKKAAKERQKAFADIEQARRAEGREDWKTVNELRSKAEDRLARADELGINATSDIFKVKGQAAVSLYNTAVSEAGQNARLERSLANQMAIAKIPSKDKDTTMAEFSKFIEGRPLLQNASEQEQIKAFVKAKLLLSGVFGGKGGLDVVNEPGPKGGGVLPR